VRDHLKVSVAGSGDVRHIGSPTVGKTVSESGDVEQIDE